MRIWNHKIEGYDRRPITSCSSIAIKNNGHLAFIVFIKSITENSWKDFPNGPLIKNPSANAEDTGLIPGQGKFHMLQGN